MSAVTRPMSYDLYVYGISYYVYEAPMRYYGRPARLFRRHFFGHNGQRLARKRWPWPEAPGWSDSKIRSGT